MRYSLRRYWTPIAVLLFFIIAINYFGWTGKVKPEVYIGLMVGGITTFIASIAHYHNADKFFKELFTEFNARYDKMNEFLNTIDGGKQLDKEGRQKVVDYLNLCAEEYMWVRKGRIPEHIWKSWRNGIRQYLKNPVIRQVFEEERSLWKSSYYGFFDELD